MDKILDLKQIVINTLDTNKAENIVSISLKDNIAISPLLNAKDEEDFIERMREYEKHRTPGS